MLSNRVYDVLKYCVIVAIPALATAYVGFAGVLGWPYADKVAKCSAIVCTLLGTLLSISTAQYNKHEPPND